MFILKVVFTLFFLNLPSIVLAKDFSVPKLSSSVIDNANFLQSATQNKLKSVFFELRNQDIAHIVFLSIKTLNGENIDQASIKITEDWKLGSKEKDNGLLILFAKKEKKVRIEVGQGLEGLLTDAKSSRIIRQVIVPLMKQGKSDQAILQGIYHIVENISSKNFAKQIFGKSFVRHTKKKKKSSLLVIFFFLFFLLGGRGGLFSLFLASQLGGRYSGMGGGGSSSFGGGGFGGGGGFSGGGASGSW